MIALITPTGARPKQIRLCAEWMKHQTYNGSVLWIVVDDAIPITVDFIPYNFRDDWTVIKLFPRPAWIKGQNTQKRNLLSAVCKLESCKDYYDIEFIFIIEDDDYYFPTYLDEMCKKLNGRDAVGQIQPLYYNVISGIRKRNTNVHYSSLFQTAIHIKQLPLFKNVLLNGRDKFVDIDLWKGLNRNKVNLFNSVDLSIGMKGMPGREGIGMGHKVKTTRLYSTKVRNTMKSLIGDDYLKYEQ